ncbi:hypothetical protein MFRU_005g00930 [Monilinia fructicola]|uniref:GH16 domain-containing protein n=1 Tax=Monilinia fructicola TaxID=38448 RepID=A0A5M9JQ59_MONFR|nr:hypothetical protein EYC84_002280 [Monilinia fructicola]KAG4033076.1 hypothetical protein MFRU_005g00930 [Monilinia fructicola]
MRFYSLYFVVFTLGLLKNAGADSTSNCSCGYYDPATENLFTDFLIVYFNETNTFPSEVFQNQEYENKYEKSWNARYRQAADPSNVRITNSTAGSIGNSSSLEFTINPSTSHHVVKGGAIRTLRSDIQYGSFRSTIRPAQAWTGGTGMSMLLKYNETQNIQINSLNQQKPTDAWINTLLGEEFPDRVRGLNFSTLSNNASYSPEINPWDLTEIRVDWTQDSVKFYIGNVLARSVFTKNSSSKTFPVTPSPLLFKLWSNGDSYFTAGPPTKKTTANLGWTRSFFNSSVMTKEQHKEFDTRCAVTDACLMDDISLRGYTDFGVDSIAKWKAIHHESGVRTFAYICLSCSVALTVLLLCNVTFQRWPTKDSKAPKEPKVYTCYRLPPQISNPNLYMSPGMSKTASTRASSMNFKNSKDDLEITQIGFTPGSSSLTLKDMVNQESKNMSFATSRQLSPSNMSGFTLNDPMTPSASTNRLHSYNDTPTDSEPVSTNNSMYLGIEGHSALDGMTPKNSFMYRHPDESPEKKGWVMPSTTEIKETEISRPSPPNHAVSEVPAPIAFPAAPINARPAPTKRIEYLAGLISIATLLVTFIHFIFTFSPAMGMVGALEHYSFEVTFRKTAGSYLLNQILLGLFFITSTRFLISRYLRTGDLGSIAEKTTGRTFRVMIPIAACAMLEYFLMDVGALKWLEYLPSISWTTWPYAVEYPDFSHYISEVLELVYLLPNAAPQITYNYCTGVLWTIPVQIEGSWITLLGCIVVRQIKTPWKRMCYYVFCILNHWYAQSWGTFFWFGVLYTDLDVTFKYKKWLKDHAFVLWTSIALGFLLGIAGLSNDLITAWTGFSLPIVERGIHPDLETGLPIAQTANAGYPDYFNPRFNGILFAVGIQFVVENCYFVQYFLSMKLWLMLFPHIFTIYLIHGLIWWSLGSLVCVNLAANTSLPYWSVALITAVVCYGTLFASLPILTPVVETLGKNVTGNIWRMAHLKPAPRRKTLFPFPDRLFLEYEEKGDKEVTDHENDVEKKAGVDVHQQEV